MRERVLAILVIGLAAGCATTRTKAVVIESAQNPLSGNAILHEEVVHGPWVHRRGCPTPKNTVTVTADDQQICVSFKSTEWKQGNASPPAPLDTTKSKFWFIVDGAKTGDFQFTEDADPLALGQCGGYYIWQRSQSGCSQYNGVLKTSSQEMTFVRHDGPSAGGTDTTLGRWTFQRATAGASAQAQ